MGLTLKCIRLTRSGKYEFRKRIPRDVVELVGKSEFKRVLGETEREALRNYPKIRSQYEKLIEDARSSSTPTGPLTELELHRLAQLRAAELAETNVSIGGRLLSAIEPEAADILRDSFISGGIADPVELGAVNLLANGGRLPRPVPTIEDARRLYLSEKVTGDLNEMKRTNRLGRVMALLTRFIEPSRTLDNLSREDARAIRDHMLRELEMKPGTVKRYIADIRSIINLGMREHDLSSAINPFNGLTVRSDTRAIDERRPIPENMLPELNRQIRENASPALWQIWQMLEGTGCRLAEVTALLVGDVKLTASIPHLDIGFRDHRRIKNQSSARRVPLIGSALEAAKEAVKVAGESPYLFVQYAGVLNTKKGSGRSKRDATYASNALMKLVRKVASDPKITVHSLRHTIEDRLIRARVEEFDRNLVLGHTHGGMSERYGGPEARLEAAYRALTAAFRIQETEAIR